MHRKVLGLRNAAACALALATLTACGPGVEPSLARGDMVPWSFGPSWGGMRPDIPSEALTVQRIRGDAPPTGTLQPQAGNVWPDPEGPRATLANPEEALRGIPPRGSSTLDLPPIDLPSPMPGITPRPPPPPAPRLPPPQPLPRADGQVIPTPGGPRVTTGGTGNVQGTVGPGGRQGTAVRDGATTTIFEPGRPPMVVPTPR
jgi:hypothetical protein